MTHYHQVIFNPFPPHEEKIVNIRDLAERVLWTGVAGAAAAVGEIGFDLGPVWTPLVAAGVTAVLVWLRKLIPAVPDPGTGLPGLRT